MTPLEQIRDHLWFEAHNETDHAAKLINGVRYTLRLTEDSDVWVSPASIGQARVDADAALQAAERAVSRVRALRDALKKAVAIPCPHPDVVDACNGKSYCVQCEGEIDT